MNPNKPLWLYKKKRNPEDTVNPWARLASITLGGAGAGAHVCVCVCVCADRRSKLLLLRTRQGAPILDGPGNRNGISHLSTDCTREEDRAALAEHTPFWWRRHGRPDGNWNHSDIVGLICTLSSSPGRLPMRKPTVSQMSKTEARQKQQLTSFTVKNPYNLIRL